MTALHTVSADTLAAQPWRNGGGRTRELLCWPETTEWSARVSLADIDTDGPFSAYPGVERWFAVIEGEGVSLQFARAERRIEGGDAPLHFDGADAPHCRLVDGPTRDLNLMLRGGQGLMCTAEPGMAWRASFQWRALFTVGSGRWVGEGGERRVEARSLLWSDRGEAGAWRFEPDAPGNRAWWMGFTPGRGVVAPGRGA